MFFDSMCNKCHVGLSHEHTKEECKEFTRIRIATEMPSDRIVSQEEMHDVMAYEKQNGKLPELIHKPEKATR